MTRLNGPLMTAALVLAVVALLVFVVAHVDVVFH
jgi:hypothetical protein